MADLKLDLNIDLKMSPGGISRTRLDGSRAFVARFVSPPTFLTLLRPLIRVTLLAATRIPEAIKSPPLLNM